MVDLREQDCRNEVRKVMDEYNAEPKPIQTDELWEYAEAFYSFLFFALGTIEHLQEAQAKPKEVE